MIQAIVSSILRAGSSAAKAMPKAPVSKALMPRVTRTRAPLSKPNKIIRQQLPGSPVPTRSPAIPGRLPSTIPSRPLVPYNPPERINVPFSPRPGNTHPGNAAIPDLSHTTHYKKAPEESSAPNVSPIADIPSTRTDDGLMLTAAQYAAQNGSSFIPSLGWTASVDARGFKETPLRTVLHYALAVVLGMNQQARVGHSFYKIQLLPKENRAIVTFKSSTQLLLEPFNVLTTTLSVAKDSILGKKNAANTPWWVVSPVAGIADAVVTLDGMIRDLGKGNDAGNGNKEMKGPNNPPNAINELMKFLGEVNRRIGPGGMWDMARNNYYAGVPTPMAMVPGVEPYSTMLTEHFLQADATPMLTKTLAANPQAPQFKDMHYPTHFDLRSLVAQALYDPGVLPPRPDTYVALPNGEL